MNKLYFGEAIDFIKSVEDDSIGMVYTDIPYGKNYKSNRQGIDRKASIGRKGENIIRKQYFSQINNDNKIPDIKWLKEAYRVLKNNSAIYVCVSWETFGELKLQAIDAGFKPKNMIVLNKSNHGMGDLKGQYAPKHELILFATKGRHILHFPEKRQNDVWDVPVKFSGSHRLHPNEKPLSWIIPAILNSSSENDIILDPFMGSGSTGEASFKTKRFFYGCDNDKVYFNIAKNRLNIN
jgi:site-specific DNA-methyltransferase (adenine-specific)